MTFSLRSASATAALGTQLAAPADDQYDAAPRPPCDGGHTVTFRPPPRVARQRRKERGARVGRGVAFFASLALRHAPTLTAATPAHNPEKLRTFRTRSCDETSD